MRRSTRDLVLASFFLAAALLLPFVTGQIPSLGNRILPMHIPVLLCGFFCGGSYGLIVGAVAPVLRSFIFGAPPLFPIAAAMVFELAAYGLVAGLLYRRRARGRRLVYPALIGAMVVGRIVWGVAAWFLYPMAGVPFSLSIFFTVAFVNAVPGILLQLVLIPAIVLAVREAGR